MLNNNNNNNLNQYFISVIGNGDEATVEDSPYSGHFTTLTKQGDCSCLRYFEYVRHLYI